MKDMCMLAWRRLGLRLGQARALYFTDAMAMAARFTQHWAEIHLLAFEATYLALARGLPTCDRGMVSESELLMARIPPSHGRTPPHPARRLPSHLRTLRDCRD